MTVKAGSAGAGPAGHALAQRLATAAAGHRRTGRPAPFFVRPIVRAVADKVERGFFGPQISSQLAFMEGELQQRDWFAGKAFSAADVQMSFPLQAAQARAGLNARQHPRLADWLARIQARPAYQRALARGGPYAVTGAAQS